jgi:hypothetical protein
MSYKLPPTSHANVYSTQIQAYSGTTNGQTITFTNIDDSAGIILTGNTKIQVTSNGYYQFGVSAIFNQTSGSGFEYDLWFSKNGVLIPNTNTKIVIASATSEQLLSVLITMNLLALQYIEFIWYCSSANGRLLATAAGTNPTRPLSPSIIVSVIKVSE